MENYPVIVEQDEGNIYIYIYIIEHNIEKEEAENSSVEGMKITEQSTTKEEEMTISEQPAEEIPPMLNLVEPIKADDTPVFRKTENNNITPTSKIVRENSMRSEQNIHKIESPKHIRNEASLVSVMMSQAVEDKFKEIENTLKLELRYLSQSVDSRFYDIEGKLELLGAEDKSLLLTDEKTNEAPIIKTEEFVAEKPFNTDYMEKHKQKVSQKLSDVTKNVDFMMIKIEEFENNNLQFNEKYNEAKAARNKMNNNFLTLQKILNPKLNLKLKLEGMEDIADVKNFAGYGGKKNGGTEKSKKDEKEKGRNQPLT